MKIYFNLVIYFMYLKMKQNNMKEKEYKEREAKRFTKMFKKIYNDSCHNFVKENTGEYCHKFFHKYLYNYPNKCFTKDEIDRAKFLKKDINRAKHLEKYKYK